MRAERPFIRHACGRSANQSRFRPRVDEDEKRQFVENAEALGMNASTALKVFVRKFNECGGFPFEVRRESGIDCPGQQVLHARMEDGRLVVPAAWRDLDDDG